MQIRHLSIILALVGLLWSCGSDVPPEVAAEWAHLPDKINYNFHIKPILSDRCYSCHGPDEKARKADLRLDLEAQAKAKLKDNRRAIQPGQPGRSSLCDRILSSDEEYRMPPADSKLTLTHREKAMLVKWIEQGAVFEKHWSFIPPTPTTVPEVPSDYEVANEIDAFVINQMLLRQLEPADRAAKERQLKRVYMDLTGLPPTVAEQDAFLQSSDPDAYEQVVDRLLASDACAERLTLEWMDVARYADSHGLHADGWRRMWPWRDWVIDAFKDNMSYDEFVTKQLAGDLLPDAHREDILATAFHRNHPMTAEGGAIDEEYRLEYVADRTNTTATAFMGMTMECAKCHDHKFDPISQKQYYQLSAFFNNVKELGMTGDDGDYGPMLKLISSDTEQLLSDLAGDVAALDDEIEQTSARLQEASSTDLSTGSLDRGLHAHLPLERIRSSQRDQRTVFELDGHRSYTTSAERALSEGKIGKSIQLETGFDELYLEGKGNFDVQDAFAGALWIKTTKKKEGKTQVLMGNAGDKNNFWRGWDFYLDDQNTLSLRLIHSLPHNYLHVKTETSVPLDEWTHVAFSYDGSAQASGSQLYINGQAQEISVEYDRLYKNIRTISSGANNEINRALRIGKSYRGFTGDNGIFLGWIDEVRLYQRALSGWEVAQLAMLPDEQIPPDAIKHHHLLQAPMLQRLQTERADALKKYIAAMDTIDEIMVMEELPQPRATFVLNRGQYDSPQEEVAPATPEEILAFPADYPTNRLGLAQWLFHPDHPLTARVTVNRYWQMIFGRGLVKTVQDFGNQGSLPSHPALLDWLALDLQKSGWDIKALLKEMVTSATYRQASGATSQQKELDPENIYLSVSPSYRWPAELIRDNALAASGLLVRKVGGPSVKPYQPEGLWIEKGNFSHKLLRYEVDSGDDLYRRSLYTFIKRTSPHPVMTTFDVPSRDVCHVSRESTNTPLQALILLNEPLFVECARVLASEMLQKEGDTDSQVVYGFRAVTGRSPSQDEIGILAEMYVRELETYGTEASAAKNLLAVGESKVGATVPAKRLAAMTVVASTLLNLDEAYMKR